MYCRRFGLQFRSFDSIGPTHFKVKWVPYLSALNVPNEDYSERKVLRDQRGNQNSYIKEDQTRQHNGKRKSTKGHTMSYQTLHNKLNIEQHEPH